MLGEARRPIVQPFSLAARRPAPDLESSIDAQCIRGLGSVGERMLILLDIERLMAGVDMGLATAAS